MKKIIYCILFFLIYQVALSQTHRFFYEVKFLNDTINKEYLEDIVVLDVNPENIKSYSNNYLITDSMRQKARSELSFVQPIFKNKISKSINSDAFKNFESIYNNYYSIETEDKMIWTISSEKKEIGSLKVQKAETDFGGRHWIAWFSTDLPFPYGPYKFSGLPGLILKIADSQNQYEFNFIKNRNFKETQDTSFFLEVYYGFFKPIAVSEKQFAKLKMDYYLDPYSDVKSGREKVTFYDDNGIEKVPNFPQMTSDMQKMLRENNNSIERNQGINYPVK
ncbi:GLPGLI family protein [Kaistella jeonii]|uniref:GLPGLI family protein n=1 Tax=Kaistella jeonii TaxID=266749 RepID=A0A0C1F8N8_9FLAO|nr:GLPGLI family protein [Kaistella jeonii]KIA88248.1 hypothetical protein OA86_12080 [Kaistella jeonii]SFC26954.1 GLPGLI family protein [Kaistella jeonii]VEI95718.1 GLPGLI family protein [Kaistella jeonii]